MKRFSYLEVGEEKGHLVFDSGVVDADKVDTMQPRKRDFVRLFLAKGAASSSLPDARTRYMISQVTGVIEALKGGCVRAAAPSQAKKAVRQLTGYQYGSYNPLAGHIVPLCIIGETHKNLDQMLELLESEERTLSPFLVQYSASNKALSGMSKVIGTMMVGELTKSMLGLASEKKPVSSTVAQEGKALPQLDRRRKLAQNWPIATEVNKMLGSTAVNARKKPAMLRRDGRLLGVWVEAENLYRYPDFQFTKDGLTDQMKELLSILPQDNGSGWGRVQWFYTPHALLQKQTPADVFKSDPDKVVDVARRQHAEGRDASW